MRVDSDDDSFDAKEAFVFPISRASIFFQLLLILASLYYSMMLTNWGNPTVNLDTTDFYQQNEVSYWLRIVSIWVAVTTFLFSLLAPLVLKDRDFS